MTSSAVSPPDVYSLLPPLLSFLPTAFFSPRPTQEFLSLLSPILRQRVHLLSSSSSDSRSHDNSSGNWLPLLTWRADLKPRLVQIVSELQLEAHPVSGELDLFGDDPSPDAGHVEYKRLDGETLHARVAVSQYGLAVVWLWCTGDDGAVGIEALNAAFMPDVSRTAGAKKTVDGWRVAEILPLKDEEEKSIPSEGNWSATVQEAEEAFKSLKSVPVTHVVPDNSSGAEEGEEEDDDDDYWASYDRTPGPASLKPTPKPPTPGATNGTGGAGSVSELDYYERYGSVQPAMDPHDPDEAQGSESYGGTLGREHQQQEAQRGRQEMKREPSYFNGVVGNGINGADASEQREECEIHSPSPTRPNSQDGQRPVNVLQRKASCSTAVELGVKQHVSHELKSLFRLCQSVGIERSEFERMVELELATLGAIEL